MHNHNLRRLDSYTEIYVKVIHYLSGIKELWKSIFVQILVTFCYYTSVSYLTAVGQANHIYVSTVGLI